MNFDISKILTDAYMLISSMFHASIIAIILYFLFVKIFGLSYINLSLIVDSIYKSNLTLKIIRIIKIFRISAIFPVFLLISAYSISKLEFSILDAAGNFLDFIFPNSYDPNLHLFRLASNQELAFVAVDGCLPECPREELLTGIDLGRFAETYHSLRETIKIDRPELIDNRYNVLSMPWIQILSSYISAGKILFLLCILLFIFRGRITNIFKINPISRLRALKYLIVIFILLSTIRVEWEEQIEFFTLDEFSRVVAVSRLAPRHAFASDMSKSLDDNEIIKWRESILSKYYEGSFWWIKYNMARINRAACMPTRGLAPYPKIFAISQENRCDFKLAIKGDLNR